MLTSKQYEAVGRLALSFNEIEYCFEAYTAHLLATPEWAVSVLLAEEGMFRQKAERFKKILKAVRAARPAFDAHIESVLTLVKRAEDLAKSRNEYVHALVVHDYSTNETKLRIRETETVLDEKKVNDLACLAEVLVNKFHTECGDLLVLVGEARESL